MIKDDQLAFDTPSYIHVGPAPAVDAPAADPTSEGNMGQSPENMEQVKGLSEPVSVEAKGSAAGAARMAKKGDMTVPPQPNGGYKQSVETEGAEPAPESGNALTPSGSQTQSLYFLTNRMNLNGILSSRLLAPRQAFHKYYGDLLEQSPGWVPLLTEAPTARLIEAVVAEPGAGVPVIIEFPPGVAPKSRSGGPVVHVGAVALANAVAIHFPSDRDLREHRARGYSNVHAHDDLLRVTPRLFESQESGMPVLRPPGNCPSVDWRSVDRIRGAISAAVAAVHSGQTLALAAAVLGAAKLPTAVPIPSWLGWPEIDDHTPGAGHRQSNSTIADQIGFRAVYDVLGERDVAESWSPNEVLDAVENGVREAGLADADADAMFRNLNRVRAIVNVEVDFEPFRSSAHALISAKALLLVLLRRDLHQLLAWSEDETGADDVTEMVAAIFAGRLRGLSRESTGLRSLALDDLTAAWAVRIASGRSASLGRIQFVANTRGTWLKIDGVEIAAQSALLPDLVSKYRKTADPKKEALRIRVSRAMGWPVKHCITVPDGAMVQAGKSVITVTTPGEVLVQVSVDEGDFVSRLEALADTGRQQAAAAFASKR